MVHYQYPSTLASDQRTRPSDHASVAKLYASFVNIGVTTKPYRQPSHQRVVTLHCEALDADEQWCRAFRRWDCGTYLYYRGGSQSASILCNETLSVMNLLGMLFDRSPPCAKILRALHLSISKFHKIQKRADIWN